jgi:hypothetical protein
MSMRGTIIFWLSMLLAAPTSAQSAFLDGERERLRAHFDEVLTELEAADTSSLSAEQRARRAQHLVRLAEYRDRGVFPRRYSGPPGLVPEFRDVHGTRCAMGELIYLSGETQLVDDVAATANSATIAELSADPRLTRWLRENGMTVEEAGRVQPGYNTPPASCFCDVTHDSLFRAVATGNATLPASGRGFHVVEVELMERLSGADVRAEGELESVWVRFAATPGQSLLVGFEDFEGATGIAYPTFDGDATVACSTTSRAVGAYAGWSTCRADSKVAFDVAVNAMQRSGSECRMVLADEDTSLARTCGGSGCAAASAAETRTPWMILCAALGILVGFQRRRVVP